MFKGGSYYCDNCKKPFQTWKKLEVILVDGKPKEYCKKCSKKYIKKLERLKIDSAHCSKCLFWNLCNRIHFYKLPGKPLECSEYFEVTEDHLKLLKRMYIEWSEWEAGAPCVDPKRPYGNSYVEGDVLEILDIPLPPIKNEYGEISYTEEQEEFARKIHFETLYALQIAIATGKFEVGRYKRKDKWVWSYL